MQRNYCTYAGMQAANREYHLLKNEVCKTPIPDTGRNSVRDSEMGETFDHLHELGIKHKRMEVLVTFMRDHEPVTQVLTDRGRIGNLVRIVYDDEAGKEIKMAFVLGGAGEPEIYKDPDIPILNYQGDFGKLFMGKEVGDEVTIVRNGFTTTAEIIAIELPPEVAAQVAKAA